MDLQIPFTVLFDDPKVSIPRFAKQVDSNLVVTDFNPLRHYKQCLAEVAPKLESIKVHLTQVWLVAIVGVHAEQMSVYKTY